MISGTTTACDGALISEQRSFYDANGYLIVPQLVPETFLAGVQTFLEGLVDERISTWHRVGLISETYEDMDFGSRYYMAWIAAGRPTNRTTKCDERFLTLALSDYIAQDWLVGLAAELLDADSVVALDSSFYRAKFPHDESTNLPWHQDVQCLRPISGVDFVSVWIPLVDVAEENSCLEVSPIAPEQKMFEPTWSRLSGYVCMQQADADCLSETRSVRMRRGDVLVFSPYLPHRSRDNRSWKIRWSVDFRYSPA